MKIGLSGKICSGKTTTASKIIEEYNNEVKVLHFSQKLKDIYAELFDDGSGIKNRDILIKLGLKMREIDENVWLNAFHKEEQKHDNIIVDDLRFENEYEHLKKNNYVLIRLDVSKEVQLERIKNVYPENWEEHVKKLNNVSETALDNYEFDYRINSDNVDNLNEEIFKIFKKII